MNHPLQIPEICLIIGAFVSRKSILSCIRVSKTWNTIFSSILYNKIFIIRSMGEKPLLAETLAKKAALVQNLRLGTLSAPGFFSIHYTNLTTLHLVGLPYPHNIHESSMDLFIKVIQQQNQTLRSLSLTSILYSSPHSLWLSIQECSQLEELSIRSMAVGLHDVELFWDICSRVTKLTITGHVQANKAVIPPDIPPSNKILLAFNHIFCLCHPNLSAQLKNSPNLIALETTAYCRHFSSEIYKSLMTNGNFPNLRHLKFCRIHLDDEQIALAFDTIALVKTFCVGTNQFSHNSFRSLMTKHANTISTLKLGRSSKIEGHMVQDILSGCPSLLHFSANSIKGSDIARYGWVTNRYSFHFACHTDNDNCTNPDEIILEKDWVCLGLISLDMSFDMGYNVLTDIHRHTHECQEKYKRQQKLEQYHAFRQLSRLQQLESLEIQRKTYNDSSYSLDLRFKAEGGELEQLLPLQKLKHFDFGRIDQKHYLKVLEWISENITATDDG